MKDLKFELKSSLSRIEAADQLTALAAALREGGDAELELGPGTLGLRIPDGLRSEIEVEVGDGEIELEIEFKWSTASTRTATRGKNVPAKPGRSRSGTGTGRGKSAKRAAGKSS